MTDDQHHRDHGDATLDVIALIQAALKDDDQGIDALLQGALTSGHLSHVLGNFAGIMATELARAYGPEGALQFLAHQRQHALGSAECGDGDTAELSSEPPTMTETVDHIGFEL